MLLETSALLGQWNQLTFEVLLEISLKNIK